MSTEFLGYEGILIEEKPMTVISKDLKLVTFINVFTVTPETSNGSWICSPT